MNAFLRNRLILSVLVFGLLALSFAIPTLAAPEAQQTVFPTPTPGPDGRIIYIVQPGDTLWRVSAISGVPLDELRGLNNLGPDEPIIEGQELLLGFGGPAEVTPTPGPSPTPEADQPTPTAEAGSGTLCVIVYDDANGDALRQEEEPSVPGAAISVSDSTGEVSITADSQPGLEHDCFEELPQGDYNISVAVPDGYNPTTVMNYALVLDPGTETYMDFGIQANAETIAEAPPPTGGGNSPLLGVIGGVLLVGGIGLGVVAFWMSRRDRGAVPVEEE
jgi:hypothetical protein